MKWVKKTLKWLAVSLGAVLGAAVLALALGRTVHAAGDRMGPAGVREHVTIEINGIRQELSIRGKNRENPVLLMLHGGPGSPSGYFDYFWTRGLTEDYTVVTYDQRGCGRTWYENPGAPISHELVLADVDAIVDHLRERFGQEKIFLMGHSWGTILGTEYAYAHPEKLSAYLGVGQAVRVRAGEAMGVEAAASAAEAAGDRSYVEKIRENYQLWLEDGGLDGPFQIYRSMEGKYLKGAKERPFWQQAWLFATSPDLNLQDVRWYLVDSPRVLLDRGYPLTEGLFDFDAYAMMEFQTPMYFISGGDDYVTPFALAEGYCAAISAPEKAYTAIPGTGHFTFVDAPADFAQAVKELLN